jgi:hypothetical protein
MQASALTSPPYFGLNASANLTVERPRLQSYTVPPEPLASPVIAEVVGTDTFRLVEPFRFQLPAPDHRWVTIPAGFVTDLASVPPIFQPVVSKTDLGIVAPLVHDWALRCGDPLGITQEMADDLLEFLCERQRVVPHKARLAVRAVRAAHSVDTSAERVIGAQSITGAVAGAFRAVAPVAAMALIPGGRIPAILGAARLAFRLVQGFRAARRRWTQGCVIAPNAAIYEAIIASGDRKLSTADEWPVLGFHGNER